MDKKMDLCEEAISIINELFGEFNKEEVRLKLLHDNNSSKIEELEENVMQLTRNEDIDYRFFSPRNIVSTNKEKADGLREKIADLERSNKSVFKQMMYYKEKVEKLEKLKVLLGKLWNKEENLLVESKSEEKEEIDENVTEVEIEKEGPKSIIEISLPSELRKVNHKLELCSKFIDNDPIRTKVELKSIIRNLEDMIAAIQK